MTEIRTILTNTDIFSKLPEEYIDLIAEYSNLINFSPGAKVFSEGEPGDELYIVQSGEVSIRRITKEGKTLELARFIGGDLFGEMDFFQNAGRNADAFAETDLTLLRFPKNGYDFTNILREHPEISAELLHSFLTIVAGRIRTTNKIVTENSPLIQELRKQVYGDKLTGLYNRTYLEEQLQSYLTPSNSPVSLLMVKPDNFKHINDNYGHEAGDQLLRILGGVYKTELKPKDALVRFMGNEFGFVVTAADKKDAHIFGEKLQEKVYSMDITDIIGNDDFHLTLSIGIAVYPEYGETADDLIQKAHELPLIGRARGGGKILFPEEKEGAVPP